MNDTSDIDDERDDSQANEAAEESEESNEEAAAPLAGERLAAARREQQISVDQVAKELHLDEPKVRALENNQFESLGAPVFAKGHLRKYALLVGISVEEAIAEYESLNQSADELPVVGLSQPVSRPAASTPVVSIVVVIILLAAAYWWFVAREPAAPTPAPARTTEPATAPASEVVTEPVSEPRDAADDVVTEGSSLEDTEDNDVAETAAPVDDSAPAAEGQVTLTVRFSGDCWTEITDARGERLFFALGREGRTANLVGTAPFSIVFGDADNVSLAIDGEPYAIPASERSGRMARLTIVSR